MKKDNRLRNAWDNSVRKTKFWLIGAATLISTTCAFGQKNYNDKCNGSPAWLSSTVETRGSVNPAAVISAKSTYYGMNQLSKYNVKRLAKFIDSNEKYVEIKNKIKFKEDGSVNNASWVALAKNHQKTFTEAQEDFICQVYLPECFKKLQLSLILDAKTKNKEPIIVSKINPAILSIFAHDYVKAPNGTKPFIGLKKSGSLEKINSEKFILSYTKPGYLQNKALSAFHDKTIEWKDAQLLAICKKAKNVANLHLSKSTTKTTNRGEEIAEIRKKISPISEKKFTLELTPYSPVAKVSKLEEPKMPASINSQIIKNGGRM